ncbi:MAG TPA: aminotransferase class IV, partial [Arenibaculum sp.]|nr:aminotransferase class IV [Arenibaculum sp.]
MRAYGGSVFRLEQHLWRLRRSMATIGLEWPHTAGYVRHALAELLEANELARGDVDARIRLTVTGGLSDGRIRLARSNPPTVLITAGPLIPPTPPEYEQGIALATASYRQPWRSPLARIKTIHRLEYLLAREEALAAGADDGLLLDDRGHVAECTASNIFIVTNRQVTTPSTHGPILPGVTRDAAIEAARNAEFLVSEDIVSPGDVVTADEVFVTS